MKHQSPPQPFGHAVNRIADVMAHTNRYGFRGVSRLAEDAGVSPSTISRLVNGRINPSFILIARITNALEGALGYRIDPRDLISELGRFLTPHVCDVVGCRGCMPENSIDEFGDLKPSFLNVNPGQWVTSRYPQGYKPNSAN